MVQLLQKLSIRASNGPEKLFKVVKGPVTKYFPAGARRVGFSFSAPEIKDMKTYVTALPDEVSVVFTVGAMSHGKIESTYTDDFISVSQYPLGGVLHKQDHELPREQVRHRLGCNTTNPIVKVSATRKETYADEITSPP